MVKNEFVKVLSKKMERTQKETKEILDLIDEAIVEVMQSEDELKLGLYAIKKEFKPERDGRNPNTGEPLTISARNTVKVKVGKKLKDAVN